MRRVQDSNPHDHEVINVFKTHKYTKYDPPYERSPSLYDRGLLVK